MSRRIQDALDVLRLIRDSYLKNNSIEIKNLRTKAINIVAKRGVESNTVFAHLVGKNMPSKLAAHEFDSLLDDWLVNKSMKLKEWYLRDVDRYDKMLIDSFFVQPQELDTPKASDIDLPETVRVETTTYRILRDTALSREVKIAQKFECQLCTKRIRLSDGSFYAEAHHVRPLGKPHNGPDVEENIICVCPNCHVLLDYGVIKLEKSQLQNVCLDYVDYHNKEIYGKRQKFENNVF